MPTIAICPLCPKGSAVQILVPAVINGEVKEVCHHCKANPNDRNRVIEELKEVVRKIERKPIKKVSDKRKIQDRIYAKKKKAYLAEHPICEFPGCTSKATDLHHTKGRVGKNYTDETTFKATCRPHHTWIETHPSEARQQGLSQSRLNQDKRA